MSFPNANLFPYTAEVDARGRLSLGGCDALELAAEFGTPLYVFDEDTLRGMCREFVGGFRSRYADSSVIYACKAFINVGLARLLQEEGLGFDVVSGGELAVALRADCPPERIYFHGNNKSREELAMALECGIGRVVVDNFHELSLLAELASEQWHGTGHHAPRLAGRGPSHPRLHNDGRSGQQVRVRHPDRRCG